MGRNLSGTKIIELNGCSGCGKSTMAAALEKEFKYRKIRYIKSSDLLVQYPVKKNQIFSNGKLLFQLVKYCLSFKKIKIGRYHFFKHILRLYYSAQNAVSAGKYKIIFMDEGFVQGLSSIAYLDKIDKKRVTSDTIKILLKNFDFTSVDCYLSLQELLYRIKKRNRICQSRYDQFDSETLKEALRIQHKNLNCLHSIFPDSCQSIKINMKNCQKENVQKIINAINNIDYCENAKDGGYYE